MALESRCITFYVDEIDAPELQGARDELREAKEKYGVEVQHPQIKLEIFEDESEDFRALVLFAGDDCELMEKFIEDLPKDVVSQEDIIKFGIKTMERYNKEYGESWLARTIKSYVELARDEFEEAYGTQKNKRLERDFMTLLQEELPEYFHADRVIYKEKSTVSGEEVEFTFREVKDAILQMKQQKLKKG